MRKNDVIVNEAIKETYVIPPSVCDGKYTKTTQFMLPSIGLTNRNHLMRKFFINSFLDDRKHRHEYERPIFVLFGVEDFKDKDWYKVYSALLKSPNYIGDYDCGIQDKKKLVMMVFKVPDEFEKDYFNFKRGKYSKFSDAYKQKFPQEIADENGNIKESTLWQIMNKSPILMRLLEEDFGLDEGSMDDAEEIWDRPSRKREYYRYEEIIPGRQANTTEGA